MFLIGDDEYKTETDPAGLRQCRARAAGRALHVRDRRPQDAARLQGDRGARMTPTSGRERPPPGPLGRPDERDSQVRRSGQAGGGNPHGQPRLRRPRQGTCRAMPSGPRSTPTCWAAITPVIMPNDIKPRITAASGAESHPHARGREHSVSRPGSLYKTSPLAASTRALLMGTIPGQPAEPVAWVNSWGLARLLHVAGPSR